ncbi:MAG TPA: hypothetical protein VHK88_07905 [Aquihabitans sp.]|nr:hypothetical protein [Aquihabitans sp.]
MLPEWGPTVAAARIDDGGDGTRIRPGARGAIRPPVGPWIPFRVTAFVPGVSWAWRVAGVPATAHRVEDLGDGRCRVGFRVPLVAAPYAAVCAVALRRIEALLT